MKIYIIGAHSTGKTTLCRYISKKYNLPLINEVARTVLSEKEINLNILRTDLEVVDDFQKCVFFKQMEKENDLESFVSDRSFDNLAYAAMHSRITSELIKTEDFKQYIENLKKDNVIMFFIRPSKATLYDDGVREKLDWDGIVGIDAMIRLMLQLWDIPHIEINTANMQERVNIVEYIINKL
jgi:dephospho-CoA kinase